MSCARIRIKNSSNFHAAEPTRDGILWTVIKDVTKYLPLFSKPGRMILDLNNVIDLNAGINGEYDGMQSLPSLNKLTLSSSPQSYRLWTFGISASSKVGFSYHPSFDFEDK